MPRSRIACVELAAAVGVNLVGALGKTSRAFKKLAPQEAAAPEEKGRDQVEQRRHEEVAHHEHLPHADTIRWHTHTSQIATTSAGGLRWSRPLNPEP